MQDPVDSLMSNVYFAVLAHFSVGILSLIVFLSIFEWVTKYDGWAEIRKGNLSVAMATGGKIFGICNIYRFSVTANDSIYESILWAAIGFVLLLIAYFLFEFLTPIFRIDDELARDNRAIGFLAMMLSVSLSYIIGSAVI